MKFLFLTIFITLFGFANAQTTHSDEVSTDTIHTLNQSEKGFCFDINLSTIKDNNDVKINFKSNSSKTNLMLTDLFGGIIHEESFKEKSKEINVKSIQTNAYTTIIKTDSVYVTMTVLK